MKESASFPLSSETQFARSVTFNEDLEDKENSLTRIVRYASRRQSLTRRDALIHGTVAFVTLASPVTYLHPNYNDKPPYTLPDIPGLRWTQVVSSWLPTSGLFYLACIDFILTRAASIIPDELSDILQGLSKEEVRRRDWFIGVISALSAIPLTTPLVKYPLINTGNPHYDTPGRVALVALILVANSIAHLRPLQIILTNKWYGAPIFAARYLKEKIDDRRLTTWERSEKKSEARAAAEKAQLKAQIVGTLMAKKDQLIDDCFVPVRKYGCIPGYELKLSEDFKRISALKDSSFISELLNYKQTTGIISPQPACAYIFFLNVIGQIGGAMVLGEAVGYLSNAGIELSILTKSVIAGWALAAIPDWAFGVLFHNIGRLQAQTNLDFAIGFLGGKQTFSWPIKYCAGIFFGGLLAPNLWISFMTTGSANTMIRGDLQDSWGEDFTDQYIGVFRWAFVGLVIFLMTDIEKYLITKCAKYFGSPNAQEIVALEEKVGQIAALLPQLQDKILEKHLGKEIPVSEPALSTPSDSDSAINSSSPRRSWCEWFSCRSSRPAEESLLNADITDDTPTQTSAWSRLCCWRR